MYYKVICLQIFFFLLHSQTSEMNKGEIVQNIKKKRRRGNETKQKNTEVMPSFLQCYLVFLNLPERRRNNSIQELGLCFNFFLKKCN